MAKKFVIVKFEEECQKLEKKLDRDLTREEEEAAAAVLWRKLHDDKDPTPEELRDFLFEIDTEYAEVILQGGNDAIDAANTVEHQKKLLVH